MTGQKFGRLTVIQKSKKAGQKEVCWLARCDCGNEIILRGSSLRNGNSKSCGCYHSDRVRETMTTHGMYQHPVYGIWDAMVQRCTNPNVKQYHDYGGRGIRVCDEWRESFEAFFDHIGDRPSPELTLDRIDNDGGYEPGNVRWATRKQQTANRRVS